MKFALGKKLGMTTIYNEDGAQNVTLVEIASNKIDLVRDAQKDGYDAVRVSAPKTTKKEMKVEFRPSSTEGFEQGAEITADVFSVGDIVQVSAIAKAKGFQGVVKRHGFKGGPASHGHRHALRAPGSIGSAFPQHVIKGKRMAGRMGGKRSTAIGIQVVSIDSDSGIIALRGPVPGVSGRMVEIVTQ